MTNNVHWQTGLMAINPRSIETHKGRILKALAITNDGENKALDLTVKRDSDGLEEILSISNYNICMFDEEDINPKNKIDWIKELYEDFGVENQSGLVGREVNGLYYSGVRLVGISRY
jgi:hypothetical protein